MSLTADLFDKHSEAVAVCELQFRSFGSRLRFSGPCVPLWSNKDHRPVLALLEQPGNGRVLVVDVAGCMTIGVMGDRLARFACVNGWAGVVINGVVRDTAAIDEMDIGVKALGATARRAQQPTDGSQPRTVSFGGVTFEEGHWVYADEDAVVVTPGYIEPSVPDEE